ncbi:hypothetical protein T492DRAFT_969377 [Pavlovales sp. CCMP2436]|nr:hypothetical protein T492DRAFT_969377 [Pavlovales sp. CCMP2436]
MASTLPEPTVVRLRGAAPGAQGRHEGHTAELIIGQPDRFPSECVRCRVVSTGATLVVEPGHADLVGRRMRPGHLCMPRLCASESFLRRVMLPLLHHVELLELVLDHIKLPQVSMAEVRAMSASSVARQFAPAQCSATQTLSSDEETWWLSDTDTCPNGVGSEWVLYKLRPEGRARVQFVSLKIPKLPYGPLSVRVFHIEASDAEHGPFVRVSPDLCTFDTQRMQEVALAPAVEASFIRVVCTVNAAASELEDKWQRLSGMRLNEASSIGFFQLSFA